MEPLNIYTSCTSISFPGSLHHHYSSDTACLLAPLDKLPTQRVGTVHVFRIGYTGPPCDLESTKPSMQSLVHHPVVVDQYLATEIQEHRVAGPFHSGTMPAAHISRFRVIPKVHQPTEWHLIVELSHPQGKTINDGIPKELCSKTYITIDDAVQRIVALG